MQRLVNGELVDMTQEEIDEMQQEQAQASASAAWREFQARAIEALNQSDRTVLRCVENGVPVPAEWVAYRKSLRTIVSTTTGDGTGTFPTAPAYPAGT